jgi:hypothetical protein
MHPRPWTVAAAACVLSLLVASMMLPAIPPAEAETQPGSIPSVDPADAPVATTLDKREAKGVLGSAVRSATDEDMGRVIDVVVDRNGSPRAAVIDFGGFLGVGSRKIAISWNAIRFHRADTITLDLTRDQVKAAPQYEQGKPVVVLGASAEFARSHVSERIQER